MAAVSAGKSTDFTWLRAGLFGEGIDSDLGPATVNGLNTGPDGIAGPVARAVMSP